MPWFKRVRRPGTRRAQPRARGKRGLMGTNRTKQPSRASPRARAAAWTAWPPRMSGLVATSAMRSGLDGMRLREGQRGGTGPGGGRRGAREERAAPKLERQDRPHLQPELAVAGPAQQALDRRPLEDFAGEALPREQQVAREAMQGPSKPAAQGDREAALGPLQDRVRHQALEGA